MKKLEELGISPAPWLVDCDGEISCKYIRHTIRPNEERIRIVAKPNFHFDESKADACIISAAPDLYNALREAINSYCEGCNDFVNGDQRCDPCECPARKWRAALAKAEGVEVADGK